jgi:hypothetical protein
MNRFKSIRQGMGFAQASNYPPGVQPPPQPIPSAQVLSYRQQQVQQAQANGMSPHQAQMAHQMQQQHQQALMQQQQAPRFVQPGPSASPAPQRPPVPAQHAYQPPVHLNAQAGPSNPSPVTPSPHMLQQSHSMPSPHQKNMRPPMNGHPNPLLRTLTPQQSLPYMHPGQAHSPAPGVPQSQQQPHPIMAAQAQVMQQRANQHLAEVNQQHQQHQLQQMSQQQQMQLQQNQRQQQQIMASSNQLYQTLGIGPVNPTLMQHSVKDCGLEGRPMDSLPMEERVSFVIADNTWILIAT